MSRAKPSIAVLYHFFPPDDIQSAVLFGDLSSDLAKLGWAVSAYPSVWSSQDDGIRYLPKEEWRGVSVRRVWRPNLPQASNRGRFGNAAWMFLRWSFISLTIHPRPDVLIVGTDPILSLSVARVWKIFSPKTKVVHWCHDMYPEAAIAGGLLVPGSWLARFFSSLMGSAYRCCAMIADLGPCMRAMLLQYPTTAKHETIVPWAFEEPEVPLPVAAEERLAVFGTTPLALLYSGSFGRAHSHEQILDLAEKLQPTGAKLAFSVRGKREDELRRAVQERNLPIPFVPFAESGQLQNRLACADIHVVTLRAEWTGMVVPSKFFGALAAGRPVLFAGSPESSLAQWIREFDLGWVLTNENLVDIQQQLLTYMSSPLQIEAMHQRCINIYRNFFSRTAQIQKFDQSMRSLIACDCGQASCSGCE